MEPFRQTVYGPKVAARLRMAHGAPVRLKVLAEYAGCSRATAHAACATLIAAGKAKQVARGEYAWTAED